ncbi:MAG: hypothetical protein RMM98_11610 [Acidobacteriota bacterium]|nr:hypothetical protein [Blastocatellia bacterium]MDW8240254.1 hypothetical protein [Acidobacteriota bacterium]
MLSQILAIILLALPLTTVWAGGKVEPIGSFTDASASESLRSALSEQGYRVFLGDNQALCDIWWRKTIPTQAKADVPGATYTELAESTFVGVISLLKPSADYRGQTLKPGAYTMRYALLPNDGNHLGAAPTRDFLLLIPVAADQAVDAPLKYDDLMALSRKASGTTHPACLSLVSAEGQKTFPAVVERGHGHVAFVATLQAASKAQFPIALIVKGVAEQ